MASFHGESTVQSLVVTIAAHKLTHIKVCSAFAQIDSFVATSTIDLLKLRQSLILTLYTNLIVPALRHLRFSEFVS